MAGTCIVGAYNTQFGSFVQKNKETGEITDTRSIYQLMDEAIRGAVEDSGLAPSQIDAVWVGSFAPAVFTNQDHLGPSPWSSYPEAFRFKPTQRVEGACASSSMAILNAMYAIESGRYPQRARSRRGEDESPQVRRSDPCACGRVVSGPRKAALE